MALRAVGGALANREEHGLRYGEVYAEVLIQEGLRTRCRDSRQNLRNRPARLVTEHSEKLAPGERLMRSSATRLWPAPAALALAGLSRLEPAPKGLLSLARPPACQEAFHANILVQVRPVDSHAAANKTPIGSLRRRPVRQAREPGQRRSDCSAIGKIDDQRLVARSHALSNCVPEFSSRNTHAMPRLGGSSRSAE